MPLHMMATLQGHIKTLSCPFRVPDIIGSDRRTHFTSRNTHI